MSADKSDDYEKEESKETPEDEAAESPATQKKEMEEGTEEHSPEGVKVPEAFQKEVHSLISQCDDKACLSYLRNCLNEKEDELRKSEMSEKETPQEFSTEGMPS